MNSRAPALLSTLAACLLASGGVGAETPHQTYHRFHHGQAVAPASGGVVYVQPSYPFTRHYIQPGQDPRFLHYRDDGSLSPHAPRRKFHPHHGYPHHGHHHQGHPYGYTDDYGHGFKGHGDRHHRRLVQDGARLNLLDRDGRVIRQVYLRAGSSWERQFGYIIISTRSRLEVYDRDLQRISGMHLPAGASFSFRRHGIVLKTRFYTELYDYNLRRLERYRS